MFDDNSPVEWEMEQGLILADELSELEEEGYEDSPQEEALELAA